MTLADAARSAPILLERALVALGYTLLDLRGCIVEETHFLLIITRTK